MQRARVIVNGVKIGDETTPRNAMKIANVLVSLNVKVTIEVTRFFPSRRHREWESEPVAIAR